jgi:hypothetical protein
MYPYDAWTLHLMFIVWAYPTMRVMFILDFIRKEEIVVDFDTFVEGW